jgi:hypothetical protein
MLLLELQQKLGMQVSLFTGLHPLWEANEVSGEVVIVKSLSYILLLMVPVVRLALLFIPVCVFVFCFIFCRPLFGSFCGFLRKC